jgi:hypothetical protein
MEAALVQDVRISAGEYSPMPFSWCVQAEMDCPVLVNTCSEAARSFYLRNGFSEVGEQPVMIGGNRHWWMVFPARSSVPGHDVPVKLTLHAEAKSGGLS